SFDVNYVYDKNKSASDLKTNENLLNVRTDMEANESSKVYGTVIGRKVFTGNEGVINSKSKNIEKTIIHETFHFLGLSDRYNDYTGNPTNIGGRDKPPHKGFENDLMGGGTMEGFNNVHYENYYNLKNIRGASDKKGQ